MFAKKIGIDLGSASTRVYVRGERIIIDERSAVPVGREVGDLAVLEPALRRLVTRAQGRQRLFRPEVMLCVPAGATSRHRRTVTEAAIAAGARQAWLIEAPLAIAMGLGLPVAEPRGHAVCDLGAGGAEVAVVSLSGVVVTRTVAAGGDHLDEAIAALVRERHGVAIERQSAEALKLALGSALPSDRARSLATTGQSVRDGATVTTLVSSTDITESLQGPLRALAEAVRSALEQTPRRLADGVAGRGLFLAGGGALLRGMDAFLARETGMPVHVADEPMTCAVRGTRRALGEFELLQRRQLYLR